MNKFEFPVTVYGNLEKYNEVTSKARCRIFINMVTEMVLI